MRPRWHAGALALLAIGALPAPGRTEDPPPRSDPTPGAPSAGSQANSKAEPTLRMTPALACLSIDGFENYELLPKAELTSDEKLQVYFRPLKYRVDADGTTYKIHLTEDARLRRRGSKAVLQAKDGLLDFEYDSKKDPGPIYLRNSISLKGLKPGDYDLEIILHDELAKGSPARQVLQFRVVPAGAR